MVKHLLVIVALSISFVGYAEERTSESAWEGIGMPVASPENPSELGATGNYKALNEWTNLSREELEQQVMDYSVIGVKEPNSTETKFIKASDILDGKYGNFDAIMPQALADSLESQQGPSGNSRENNQSTSQSSSIEKEKSAFNEWSSNLVIHLGYMTLGFASIMLLISMQMGRNGMSTNSILRINGLILVVTSAVFLVIIGYSQEQISPVIGLLGAVAGYLLGSKSDNASG